MTPAVPAAVLAGVLASHDHPAMSEWGWGDWTVFVGGLLVSAWVLWLAVRWTFRPGEEEADHVKRSILSDDPEPPPAPPAGARTTP